MLLLQGPGVNKYFCSNDKNRDTIRFIIDIAIGKEVTPFPYYLLNGFGVKKVFSKNFECDLLNVEMIRDDKLQEALNKITSFSKNDGLFYFPW
jgi:hypothetical protein